MSNLIANIATCVNPVCCDFRAYENAAISAMFSVMEEIDGQWIKNRLSGKRGEQTRLAAHLGISTDKLSKTLSGNRSVQPEEVPLLLEFFNEKIVPANSPEALLLQQIARLNTAGQAILQKQLSALLESPELVQPQRSNETDE